ncbi:MAG: hypothetical protein H0T84_00050 [Tatlockia sp.]|nr:hypothetical protein [Tatlockia sp.]
MFAQIKAFFTNLWQDITSFFLNLFKESSSFCDSDKYNFVLYILNGQHSNNKEGFALRHVDSDEINNHNIQNGFRGDAISFSITPSIMSSVLGTAVNNYRWVALESGQFSLMTEYRNMPIVLDESLAVKIFDCLHEKILQFIGLNFDGDIHHFMLIKNMKGAALPYDIKDIYPTGKCGKQAVEATQVVKVFSKNASLHDAKDMLQYIETGILRLAKPTKHPYSKESTEAILTILRDIKLSPDEQQLELDNVRKRLVEEEYDKSWSEYKFNSMYDSKGSFRIFSASIAAVNEDLEYFRALI